MPAKFNRSSFISRESNQYTNYQHPMHAYTVPYTITSSCQSLLWTEISNDTIQNFRILRGLRSDAHLSQLLQAPTMRVLLRA